MGMRYAKVFGYLARLVFAPGDLLRSRYENFKGLLEADDTALALVADLQESFYGIRPVDRTRVARLCRDLRREVGEMVARLQAMRPTRYQALDPRLEEIGGRVEALLRFREPVIDPPYVISLADAAGRPDLAGGKGANVGRVAVESDLSVPPGMVFTTTACNLILERSGLRDDLDRILSEIRMCKYSDFSKHCREMSQKVHQAVIPREILESAREALKRLSDSVDRGLMADRFAVRSSAFAEDGEFTFAGQYESVLNVPPQDIFTAFLRVLASKYVDRAVTYRILRGLADVETPMAVLVLPMVDSVAAGVTYSLDPSVDVAGGCVSVHAVPGLGVPLVGGEAGGDLFQLTREAEPVLVGGPDSGVIDARTAARAASDAMALERLFGGPQDVEWAMDRQGRMWILQSRPFDPGNSGSEDRPKPDISPLITGMTPVSMGAGSGRVLHLHDAQDAAEAPRGTVVVFETLSPNLTRCLDRVEAVIGMSGGRAGHFATVAREFGIPVVVGDPLIVAELEEGMLVTVDAVSGCVYPGRLDALVEATESARRKSREASLAGYEKLVPLITSLQLTDPDTEDFTPEGCGSMHDLIRFIHEKGVREMFDLVGKSSRGMSRSRKLITDLPLTMYVLSLDHPLAGRSRDGVTPDEVHSAPMRAVWRGLEEDESHWEQGLHHVDWEEMDRVSAGIFGKDARFLSSYALVAEDYMHMMIRFGYHFSVLDSVCGPEDKNNYVQFRFKGGGADFDGRLLRLCFLERVLRASGFEVQLTSDMLDAKLARKSDRVTLAGLQVLGRLLARTRLMDMKLFEVTQMEELAEAFLAELDR